MYEGWSGGTVLAWTYLIDLLRSLAVPRMLQPPVPTRVASRRYVEQADSGKESDEQVHLHFNHSRLLFTFRSARKSKVFGWIVSSVYGVEPAGLALGLLIMTCFPGPKPFTPVNSQQEMDGTGKDKGHASHSPVFTPGLQISLAFGVPLLEALLRLEAGV
jgi:hypothetical protein